MPNVPENNPLLATAGDLIKRIKQNLIARTLLPEDAAELVAFWVISTWFPDQLTILPCLVITGPAHPASLVLHVLRDLPSGGFSRPDSGAATLTYSAKSVRPS